MALTTISIQSSLVILFTITLRMCVGKTTGSLPVEQCTQMCNLSNGFCGPNGKCSCYNGWEGDSCQQCVRAVGCRHGICQQPDECICEEGYGGRHCHLDMKFCERQSPCQNGGTCLNDGNGSYSCKCRIGFTGKTCAYPNNRLVRPSLLHKSGESKIKCKNGGRCINEQCAECSCPSGFVGTRCERRMFLCVTSPCANGAQCHDLIGDYHCECATGFSGERCEEDIDECAILGKNACENGGRCRNLKGTYKCLCPDGFEGARCKKLVQRLKPPSQEAPTSSESNKLLNGQSENQDSIYSRKENSIKSSQSSTNIKVEYINQYSTNIKVNHVEVESKDFSKNNDQNQSSANVAQAITFAFLGVAVVLFFGIVITVWCFYSKKRAACASLCCCIYKNKLKRFDENDADQTNADGIQVSVSQKETCRPGKVVRSGPPPIESINTQTRSTVDCLYVSLPQDGIAGQQINDKRCSLISTQNANYLLDSPKSGSVYNCDKYYY